PRRVVRGGRARRARGARADAGAGRRGGRRRWSRPARADAAAGLARGGVHEPHARRRGVRGRAAGGRRVSAATPSVRLPRIERTGSVAFGRVLLSEWTKLRSVRSTKWSLGVGFLLTVAFPIAFSFVTSSHWGSMSPQERADRHPLDIALVGVNVAQLAIAVLGVLLISAEYSTGSIRSTFTAVPKRLLVLWAKLVDYAVVSLALMVPAVLVSFFASQAIVDSIHHLRISFTQAGVARAVIGGALYVMLVGIFALAIGAIVRNTAGGI